MGGPNFCDGFHPSVGGGPCTLAAGGNRICIKGKCKRDARCKEKRCASHCKCARMGWRVGRERARPHIPAVFVPMPKAKAKAKAKAKVGPGPAAAPVVAPPASVLPVGRPSSTIVDVLEVEEWYKRMIADVLVASVVIIGTYMFDHPRLQAALLKRLLGGTAFALTVLIDKVTLEGRTPWHQRPRLAALRAAGAKILMCRGKGPKSSYHKKALVIDKRIMYTGGANFTYQSDDGGNGELTFRMTGQPVLDTLAILDRDERAAICEWGGK